MDPASDLVLESFLREVRAEREAAWGPSISVSAYGVPLYEVPAGQPTVPVKLVSQFPEPALRTAWTAVPLPPGATPATGTDGHLVVWQPSSDRLWEFWKLSHGVTGWEARWGGAMQDVSSNSGTYGKDAWPGASRSWGASGSALSIAAGLVTFADLERGRIDHALALGIPEVRASAWAWPAARTDGNSLDASSLPEGARLRLDPDLDLSTLQMPRLTRMLAEAAQRYGIVIRDGAGNITFYGQTPDPEEPNPYRGPNGYFEGKYPVPLLASFPWAHLQLLPMDLSPAS